MGWGLGANALPDVYRMVRWRLQVVVYFLIDTSPLPISGLTANEVLVCWGQGPLFAIKSGSGCSSGSASYSEASKAEDDAA